MFPAAMYPVEKLPIRTPNNAQIRDVLKGKLATGESLEVHETTLPPGGAPHAAHHHVHSNDEHGIKNPGSTPATYFVVAIGPGSDS